MTMHVDNNGNVVPGLYVWSDLPSKKYWVSVRHTGYKKNELEVTVQPAPPDTYRKIKMERSEMGKLAAEYMKQYRGIGSLNVPDSDKKKLIKDLKKSYADKFKEQRKKKREEKGEFIKTPEMEKREKEKRLYDKGGMWRKGSMLSEKYIGEKWGTNVMKVFNVLFLIILGLVVSWYFEGTIPGWFTWGFLFLGISTMMPDHKELDLPQNFILNLSDLPLLKDYLWNRHSGLSAAKSAFKFFAVFAFVMGARNSTAMGFLSNIIMIVVAALSYYSFSSEYNPRVPGQIFEAFARFFIGIIVIPWFVFYGIFNSLVLGLMATAFFAVPPSPTKEKEGESVIRGEYMRWVFLMLMLIALIGSGSIATLTEGLGLAGTWELTGALRATFLYFWVVCTLAGFFVPSAQRPSIGFIMLSAATVIYAVGPGTQDVGSAIFGPWFGKVYAGLTEVMAPVTQAFNQLGNTLGTAFQMVLNPVGYAQTIMQGTYVKDTQTGLVGAYGVEIGNFRATPIYTHEPYSIIIPIQNKGSSEARNVKVTLLAGTGVDKTAEGGKVKNLPTANKKIWKPVDPALLQAGLLTPAAGAVVAYDIYYVYSSLVKNTIDLTLMGITQDAQAASSSDSVKYGCKDAGNGRQYCTAEINRNMDKLDSEQIFFSSGDKGIPCTSVVDFGLLTTKGSKFLPFSAIVSYGYSVESSLQIEAMSQDEWTRLAQEGMLYPSQKKPSIMKNSPVMLNIDTLEQPIREGTPFFIAFNLTPVIPGKQWIENAAVTLEMPKELSDKLKRCTTPPIVESDANSNSILKWGVRSNPESTDPNTNAGTFPTSRYAIYCYFDGMPVGEGKPGQTYYIKANATFTFNDITTKAFSFEFGGIRCCNSKDDCPGEFPVCDATDKTCKPGDASGGTTTTTDLKDLEGKKEYCSEFSKRNSNKKCTLGMGGCNEGDCSSEAKYQVSPDITQSPLKCWTTIENGVCCPVDANEQQCVDAYNVWRSPGSTEEDISDALLNGLE